MDRGHENSFFLSDKSVDELQSVYCCSRELCFVPLEFWPKSVFKSLPLRKTFSVNPVFKDHQFTAMMFP